MNSGWLGSSASGATAISAGLGSRWRVSHQWSRSGVMAISAPLLRTTTMCWTEGLMAAAASAIAFIGTGLPRREVVSTVTSTLAAAARRREASASLP